MNWKNKAALRSALFRAQMTGKDTYLSSPNATYMIDGETLDMEEVDEL